MSFKALCSLHQRQGLGEIVLADIALLQRALPESALGRIAAAVAEHHRQRDLALAKIVADALAEHRRLARIVERVVDELKSKPEIAAIGAQRCRLRFRPRRDHRADLRRRGEQRRGLGVDHRQIVVLGGLGVLGGDQLHHLALGDDRRRIRQDAQRAERADIDHHLEGLAEQEIADQHARLVAPQQPRRGLAPAKVALVDHVVMQQRRRMHELDAGREPHMAVAVIVAQLGRRQREHRAQALAARIDQMPGKLGDQLDIGSGRSRMMRLTWRHVLLDKRDERRKARLSDRRRRKA